MYGIFYGNICMAEFLNSYDANGMVSKGPGISVVVEVPRPVSNTS